MATAQVEDDDAPAMVVGAEGWHPGVVGIIAARLVDRFARPAIAIGFRERGRAGLGAHGPGREPLRCAGRLLRRTSPSSAGTPAPPGMSIAGWARWMDSGRPSRPRRLVSWAAAVRRRRSRSTPR